MTSPIDRVDLSSLSITDLQKQKLKVLFPEVFTEGDKIDFERLKQTLGETVDSGKERFGMNWAGKSDCFKTIQQSSIATLVPVREESVGFDTTGNLFIEGDNLEVLKLLQKSYLGKVKMIYIDPPYNTGNDFIYPDNYSENLETYLEYTGQIDGEGRKFNTNVETDGRFHSKWMNMMYPRLFLAKNLLREDGVIFISIDDSEVHNLRALCNEVFGEENFLGCFVVNSTPNARDYGHIGKMHEYCFFYAKNYSYAETSLIPEKDKDFRYQDSISGFNIHPLYNSNEAFHVNNRPNLYYPFYVSPNKSLDSDFFEITLEKKEQYIEVYPPKSLKNGVQFVWRWGRDKALSNLNKEIIGYKTESGEFRIVQKMRHSAKIIRSILSETNYSTRRGTAELEELLEQKWFSFPKPLELLRKLVFCGTTSEQDIVIDFFAGSATTAHAVMDLNKEDRGNRKYICVQLPEPTDEKSEAYKAGYKTIAEISKERIRRAAAKIKAEQNEAQTKPDLFDEGKTNTVLDLGFRVFKLQKSNFKVWDANTPKDPEAIQQALELHIDHIDPHAKQEAILFELLLKSGFELTTPIKTLCLADKTVYSIADEALLICLDKALTPEVIRAMAALNPSRVICLDEGFQDNDQLKTNAVLIMKSHGVNDFRTV